METDEDVNKDVYMVPHYKVFPGRYKFCFNGRLYTSKAWYVIPGVLLAIWIPNILHMIFE
jgi:hypothetical protein